MFYLCETRCPRRHRRGNLYFRDDMGPGEADARRVIANYTRLAPDCPLCRVEGNAGITAFTIEVVPLPESTTAGQLEYRIRCDRDQLQLVFYAAREASAARHN